MYKLIAISAVLAANVAFCQDSAPDASKPAGAFSNMDPQTRIQLMKQFDKDGDGRLNAEERAAATEAMKNKTADLEEVRQKHVDEVIKKFDKDGDGKLDKAEMTSFLDEQRKMMEEQRRRMGPRRGEMPKELIAQYDKDGDGKLSDAERKAMRDDMRAKRDALIKKYDADGDGRLNDEERLKMTQDPEVQRFMGRALGARPRE